MILRIVSTTWVAVMVAACAAAPAEPEGTTESAYVVGDEGGGVQHCKTSEKGKKAPSADKQFYYECDGTYWATKRCGDADEFDAYRNRCDAKVGPRDVPTCQYGACSKSGVRIPSSDLHGYYECDGACFNWRNCPSGFETRSFATSGGGNLLCCPASNASDNAASCY